MTLIFLFSIEQGYWPPVEESWQSRFMDIGHDPHEAALPVSLYERVMILRSFQKAISFWGRVFP